MNNFYILISNFVTLFITIFYYFIFNDIAFIITFLAFYISFSIVLIYSKSIIKLEIFSILLPIYITLSFLISADYYYTIGVQYGYADESLFYYLGLYNNLEMLPNDFRFIADPIKYIKLIDFTAYFELLKLFGDFYHTIGYQSFLAFKITSIFGGILGILIFYEICKQFFTSIEARKISLLFGMLPLIAYQSSVLMRDILIFTLSLYVILLLLTINKKRIILLILTLITILLFRPENGLFMIISSFVFLYFTILKKKYKMTLLVLVSSIIFIIFFILLKDQLFMIVESFDKVQNGYQNKLKDISSSTSLAIKLKTLPFPLNSLATFSFSQIMPFPFWALVKESYSPIIEGIGGLIWFFVWPFTIIAIVNKEIRKKIDFRLIMLFLIFFIYIFLVANIQAMHRRLMIGYPIIWMIAYYGYMHISLYQRKIVFVCTTIFISLIYIIYFILKEF